MAGQPGDSGLEREVARSAQEAEGECDKLGKSPGPSPVDGELGLLQERHSFPTPFVLRLVLSPGAKLVAKNNWEQMLVQHPAAI